MGFSFRFLSFSCGALLLTWGLLLSGCAPIKATRKGSLALVKECTLPSDQAGSLNGRWKVPPVMLALQEGAFSEEEAQAIVAAVQTWNRFFGEVKKFEVMDLGSSNAVRTAGSSSPDTNLCTAGTLIGNDGSTQFPVVIYKRPDWPHDEQAMAITTVCPSTDVPLRRFYNAVMELNYKNFFVDGKLKPHLETIVLHELGHLMGLKHSCGQGGEAGLPKCGSGINPSYLEALMYPAFGFDAQGSGEVKNTLRVNDQGRALCLYSDKK